MDVPVLRLQKQGGPSLSCGTCNRYVVYAVANDGSSASPPRGQHVRVHAFPTRAAAEHYVADHPGLIAPVILDLNIPPMPY